MKITDITVKAFHYETPWWDKGHAVPIPKLRMRQTVTTIHTDEGVEGHYLGGSYHASDNEGLTASDSEIVTGRIRALLLGQDPLDRELIWKWLWVDNLHEHIWSVIDNALWDLAGRWFNAPAHKLMGGARAKVKPYASTFSNIGQPRVYAEHALQCKADRYHGFKIHPHYFWNPETGQPTPGRPSNVKADIETIHLVREAVGPDYVLMYDPWGTYMTMEDAIKVGRELEKLDYYWYEHPMPEYRPESYVRLCRELTIPILSPEIAGGGVFTRADWMLRGASDMTRIDTTRGGITGARKTAIIAEAFGQRCEYHTGGWANLQAIGATHEDTSEYYEKCFTAPGHDVDVPIPYLKDICDRLDENGYVTVPNGPGLGYDIVWDYINDNLIAASAP